MKANIQFESIIKMGLFKDRGNTKKEQKKIKEKRRKERKGTSKATMKVKTAFNSTSLDPGPCD